MTRLLAVCAILYSGALLAQNVPLNAPQVLTLPAVPAGQEAISTQLFFDVPASAKVIRVSLDGTQPTRDIDLFLRNAPFPTSGGGAAIFSAASFSSIGATASEYLLLTAHQLPPIKPLARWHIAIIIPAGTVAPATLRVDVLAAIPRPAPEMVFLSSGTCDATAWSDPTPVTPIGGNSATTLGAARQNAFRHSAQLLMNQLEAPALLKFSGCWERLGIDSPTRFRLAQAGPTSIIRDSPGLERANTWYARAPATKAGGTDYCRISGGLICTDVDVRATFNLDVGTMGTRNFGYHLDGAGAGNTIDFVAVVSHELTHGLGFLSLITTDANEPGETLGALLEGRPDAFTAQLVDARDPGALRSLTDPAVTDADRLAVITSLTGLRWIGPEAVTASDNSVRQSEDSQLQMFAPNPLQDGSSVSHLAVPSCNLMNASLSSSCGAVANRTLGLNKSMLNAIGWASAPKRPETGPWFDRTRSGTGFDLHMAGVDARGNGLYALGFYSYDNVGSVPEWFLASGFLRDGAFEGTTVAPKKNLARFIQGAGGAQVDASRSGCLTIDFNDAASDPACLAAPRPGAAQLAVVRWYLGSVLYRDWCIEPLSPAALRPSVDYSGIYWAGPLDQGWGVTATSYVINGQAQMSVALYFYDANNQARWVAGQVPVSNFNQPITVPMLALTGFCRDCASTNPQNANAGSITLDFRGSQSSDANRMTVNVTYPLAGGGTWVRNNIPMKLFTLANPNP